MKPNAGDHRIREIFTRARRADEATAPGYRQVRNAPRRREQRRPRRTLGFAFATGAGGLVVALTADEEGGGHNGVRWLLARRRELIESAFSLNEGGGGRMQNGKRLSNNVQLSEKMYQSFRLEAKNHGGHSSIPRKDNAIYQLSEALVRIADYDFPIQLDEITGRIDTISTSLSPVGSWIRALCPGLRPSMPSASGDRYETTSSVSGPWESQGPRIRIRLSLPPSR